MRLRFAKMYSYVPLRGVINIKKSLYKSHTWLFLRHDLAILRMERPVQLTPVRADNYHFNEETADSEDCVFRMEIWHSMNFTLI